MDCVGPNLGRNKDNNYNCNKCGAFGSADGGKRERINERVEESGMLGDIQGGFRKGRRTGNNLFMLEMA